MKLKHVVVTSVDRDDLHDKGAGHYAATIRALKSKVPAASVEVLTPDFLGYEEEAPDRARRKARGLQPQHRDGSPAAPEDRRAKVDYDRALWLLSRKGGRRVPGPDEVGIIVGLGTRRRGRGHDARPARERRRRRHDRPVPPALGEARDDRPLGAPRRVPLVPRAGRGPRLRLGLLRTASSAAGTAPTSSATRRKQAAEQSRTRKKEGRPEERPSLVVESVLLVVFADRTRSDPEVESLDLERSCPSASSSSSYVSAHASDCSQAGFRPVCVREERPLRASSTSPHIVVRVDGHVLVVTAEVPRPGSSSPSCTSVEIPKLRNGKVDCAGSM